MASIATRDAYGEALAELGAVNENVVVLEADLSKSTKTCDFKKACPDRFIKITTFTKFFLIFLIKNL